MLMQINETGEKMANLKRLEKRLKSIEDWAKALEAGTGPAQTMENMNWLVGQTRMIGERIKDSEDAVQHLQMSLQSNNEIIQKFLDKHDMVRDWQLYLDELNRAVEAQEEEADNAVQEQETEGLDAQEQAEDGEEVGEGDA